MSRTVVAYPVALAVVLACAAACGGKATDDAIDCKTILADPGSALSKLAEREPEPAAMYATLERCLAPEGDTCARAAVIGGMMPSMAAVDNPGSAAAAQRAASWDDYARQCRTLAPADQQCLLVSYAIAHPACGAVQDRFRRDHPPR